MTRAPVGERVVGALSRSPRLGGQRRLRRVAPGGGLVWSDRLLLDGDVGVQVDLNGVEVFVTKPERDDGRVAAGVQPAHRGDAGAARLG